jgi:hypothetical protein
MQSQGSSCLPRERTKHFKSTLVEVFGEVHMLSKCANPSCSTPLVYLREGKIFMIEQAPGLQSAGTAGMDKHPASARVEHFWLCGSCSAQMTLAYDSKRGILVLPKIQKKVRAAS